jgi:hypothetical protein
MNTYTLRVQARVRRKADTESLAGALERLVRPVTVGDCDLRMTRAVPEKRGGRVAIVAEWDATRDDAIAARDAIHKALETSNNLIDRVDTAQIVVTDPQSHVVAFSIVDYRYGGRLG